MTDPEFSPVLTDERIDAIAESLTWYDADVERLDHRGFARAIESAVLAKMREQEPVVCLPHPASQEASDMLDALLTEYNWPSNKKNCARAGYMAAKRLISAPQPAQPPIPAWMSIETAPKDGSVMLFAPYGLIYCGRKRFGNLGEPQQDEFAWRCDSSGRFCNPTHWMPLPSAPAGGTHE